MQENSPHNFGQLIAYLVPGFVALCGLARISPTIHAWLYEGTTQSATVSGFLFSTLAAVACGLVINALRWHLVDPLHYLSGVPRKSWDYSLLPQQIAACRYLVVHQFRYYESYANTMTAIALTGVITVATERVSVSQVVAFLAVQGLLWSASRRTLANYHLRIAQFLSRDAGNTTPVISGEQANTIDPPPVSRYKGMQAHAARRRVVIPVFFRRRAPGRYGLDDHNQ